MLMECGQMVLALVLAFLVWVEVFQVWQLALDPGPGADLRDVRAAQPPGLLFRPGRSRDTCPTRSPSIRGCSTRRGSWARHLRASVSRVLGAAGCFALNGAELPGRDRRGALDQAGPASAAAGPRGVLAQRAFGRSRATCETTGGFLPSSLLVAFFGFVGMGYEAMVPAYAQTVVETGVYGYSVLAGVQRHRGDRRGVCRRVAGRAERKERLTILGMVIFGACLAAAASLPTFFAPGPHGAAPAGGGVGLLARCRLRGGALLFVVDDSDPARGPRPPPRPDHGDLDDRLLRLGPVRCLWTGRVAQSWGVSFVMGLSAALCVVVGLMVWGRRACWRPTVASQKPRSSTCLPTKSH